MNGDLRIEKDDEEFVTWVFEGILKDSVENENLLKNTFAEGLGEQYGNKEVLWLNDTENLIVMGSDLLKLLDEFVNRNIIEHRIEGRIAFIEPLNTHGKACVKFYCIVANVRFREANLNVSMEIFKNKQEAINWLKQPASQLVAA